MRCPCAPGSVGESSPRSAYGSSSDSKSDFDGFWPNTLNGLRAQRTRSPKSKPLSRWSKKASAREASASAYSKRHLLLPSVRCRYRTARFSMYLLHARI